MIRYTLYLKNVQFKFKFKFSRLLTYMRPQSVNRRDVTKSLIDIDYIEVSGHRSMSYSQVWVVRVRV